MSDIIKLLPDSIANQIAAGEVIQRPASVVKELVENAIDAQADEIIINIKDAGRTLIQVKDNGTGMSETDARLAFERHATSKIREAKDLFSLSTMGFRGEALASIASIAQVNLKTKRESDELGVSIQISASEVEEQEPINCATGCNFQIKNLFYNIPARRKFLKADTTELRHITEELQRIALTHHEVSFKLLHNNSEILNLPKTNIRQRIVNIFGKNINQNLISIDNNTDIVKITGFVGKPEKAKKNRGQQYFFVNGRFMKHPYFYHSVMESYKNILQQGTFPSFFIFLHVEPNSIDINIHPTKTEIKFEEEKFIYQLLHVTVKEALGKFNIVPSIDFDVETDFTLPPQGKNVNVRPPEPNINTSYNPFNTSNNSDALVGKSTKTYFDKPNTENWEKLFENPLNENTEEEIVDTQLEQQADFDINTEIINDILIHNKIYGVFTYEQQLLSVNLKRALHRINFDVFISNISDNKGKTQKILYPEELELSKQDYLLLDEFYDDLSAVGFDITECKPNTISINGVPSEFENQDNKQFIESLLEMFGENKTENAKNEIKNLIANSMASSVENSHSIFTKESAKLIIIKLFACKEQTYSPNGKLILQQLVV